HVMDQMNYPRGLIRYATEASMEGQKTRVLRPRTWVYGSVLLALIVGFGVTVANRSLLELDVLRDRNALYRALPSGEIENVYTLRVVNKDAHPHELAVFVEG